MAAMLTTNITSLKNVYVNCIQYSANVFPYGGSSSLADTLMQLKTTLVKLEIHKVQYQMQRVAIDNTCPNAWVDQRNNHGG